MSSLAVTTAVVVAVVAIAFGLRAARLSIYGFSEDEINKGARGRTVPARSPLSERRAPEMLMKLAMLASVEAARTWNRVAIVESAIPMETAIVYRTRSSAPRRQRRYSACATSCFTG